MKLRAFFAALAAVLLQPFVVVTSAAEPLQKTIDYLIQATAESGLTFICNGSEHTATEAAALMKRKLAFVKGEVQTPEDFIRLAASKSQLTGKPYLVSVGNGKTVPAGEWMSDPLRKYRAAHRE